MTKRSARSVKSRNESFVHRTTTRIWEEKPSADNPYIASKCSCYGYDFLELIENCNYIEVFFLLFRGELPTQEQANLLQTLMIALLNPGPRHPATRAAMTAGVGKTDPAHILPIGLAIMGGNHLGAGSIEDGIRFFRKQSRNDPQKVIQEILPNSPAPKDGEDWQPIPGFGSRFGGIDILPHQVANRLVSLPGAGKSLSWGNDLAVALQPFGLGWLSTGLAAAVLSDLGFHPRSGAGIFQLLSAPGLLAHGLEMANKPVTAMPFPSDENYHLEKDANEQ